MIKITLCIALLMSCHAFAKPVSVAKRAPATTPSTWDEDTVDSGLRDEIFEKVGIETLITDWDELDRDRLWVHARKDKFEDLCTRFPALPSQKLKQLQLVINAVCSERSSR
jgi:hypothetical protein